MILNFRGSTAQFRPKHILSQEIRLVLDYKEVIIAIDTGLREAMAWSYRMANRPKQTPGKADFRAVQTGIGPVHTK